MAITTNKTSTSRKAKRYVGSGNDILVKPIKLVIKTNVDSMYKNRLLTYFLIFWTKCVDHCAIQRCEPLWLSSLYAHISPSTLRVDTDSMNCSDVPPNFAS